MSRASPTGTGMVMVTAAMATATDRYLTKDMAMAAAMGAQPQLARSGHQLNFFLKPFCKKNH